LPVRFPEVKGLKAASRYLAGIKSGGDYFDLAESRDGNLLSFVMTDSSSYGLSSAVLSVMVRVMMKLTQDEARSSHGTVRRIQEEMLVTLGPKDHLSLFYAVLSRKDYRLRFLNLGTSRAFYARPKEKFSELPVQGSALSRLSGPISVTESELVLEPDGRLIVVSDGFIDAAGGLSELRELLGQFRGREPVDSLNELVFKVKSRFTDPDDLPAQDCTAIVFDLDSRLIRLAAQ
jgi:serine phosphatase RsbU (regulator of sigma subunit)